MINSAIKDLERAMRILNDIPEKIMTEKRNTISTMNDTFEDFRDKLSENPEALKALTSLKIDVMNMFESFCDGIMENVEEDVRIVEE